jgi:hypothetical protein
VDPSPSITKALGNFSVRDYVNVALFTGSGYVFGFLTGKKMQMGYPFSVST